MAPQSGPRDRAARPSQRSTSPWGAAALRLKLTGGFNVANALAALTVGLDEGVPLADCVRAIHKFPYEEP